MNFEQMAKRYLASAEFHKLASTTRSMYKTGVSRLVGIGGSLPAKESDMQKTVAVARSRSAKEPEEINLVGTWYNLIDGFKTEDGPATNPTKNVLVTCLRLIYAHAVIHHGLQVRENFAPYVPRFKHQREDQKPFSLADVAKIEEAVKDGTIPDELIPDTLFAVFAFYSACRPDEMYEHEEKWIRAIDGDLYYEVHEAKGKAKGEVSRLVLLMDKEKEILEWFKSRPKAYGHAKYTFRTANGRKFTQSILWEKWNRVCTLVKIEYRSIYNMRRGLATEMNKRNYSLEDIARKLGNTPEVAKRYIWGSMADKANTFKGL